VQIRDKEYTYLHTLTTLLINADLQSYTKASKEHHLKLYMLESRTQNVDLGRAV